MATVKIKQMKTRGTFGKVKAYVSVSLGAIEIEDIKLVDGVNGLFISFPSKKISKEGEEARYVDVVRFARDSEGKFTSSAQDLYNQIFQAIIAEYERRGGEELTVSKTTGEDENTDDLPF